MTQYDLDVIEEWRQGFQRNSDVFGVQPDIWERVEYLKARGYRRFPHIQLVLGRRASKGFTSALVIGEMIGYLLSLDNPQRFYGVQDGKDMFGNVGATSQTQAQRHLFADVRNVVEHCDWMRPYIAETKDHQMRLRTPQDLRRIAAMSSSGTSVEHQIATLWVVALSASSVAGRGATSYFNAFDEFAFHVQGSDSNKDSSNIYEDWQPSLGQVKRDALTIIPSSPFSKTGKFYELYEIGRVLMSSYHDLSGMSEQAREKLSGLKANQDDTELTADPEMLIFQGPSWELYRDWESGPEVIGVRFPGAPESDLSDERQQRRRLQNPEKFAVERGGQFAEVQGQYLDPAKVDAMFAPVTWREPSNLQPVPFGQLNVPYRIHCDPSTTNANFALAIGHLETAPPDEYGECWPHVIIDRLHVWRPEDFPADPETGKRQIDYIYIERELDQILHSFPSTTKFSADQFNSIGFMQRLRAKYSPNIRIVEDTATEKANFQRCERFKSALNLGWIHSPRDKFYGDSSSLLEAECKFLSIRQGRVIKQNFGPVQTKDLFDAVSVVATDLLQDALERWANVRMGASAYGSTHTAGLRGGSEQERMGLADKNLGIYRGGSHGKGRAWADLASYELDRRRGQRHDPGYGGATRRRARSSTDWMRGRRWQ